MVIITKREQDIVEAGTRIYDAIKILDFRARPDRAVYILESENNGYVVINNDSLMNTDGSFLDKETKRDIFVGQIISPDWKRIMSDRQVYIQGIGYEHIPYTGFGGPEVVEGRMNSNEQGSYTTTNVSPIEKGTQITRILNNPILDSLEHFLVPKDVADEIREYVSKLKISK